MGSGDMKENTSWTCCDGFWGEMSSEASLMPIPPTDVNLKPLIAELLPIDEEDTRSARELTEE